MSMGSVNNVVLRGISCAVPDVLIGNDYFTGLPSETVERTSKMTGVYRRCWARPDQTASDLSCVAAMNLLKSAEERQAVDALIFITQTPDYRIPATACVMHHRLGLKQSCLAFDVNLGCSGFVYGLFIAASFCRMPGIRSVLLCGGDTSTKTMSMQDKSSVMLFGDGGFASLVEAAPDADSSPWHYLYRTNGAGYKNIIMPAGAYRHRTGNPELREFGDGIIRSDYDGYMNGTDVFTFTIKDVPVAIRELMTFAGISPEGTDLLVLHQANLYILKQVARLTKFPMDKVPVSLDRFGNTSVTSLPLTLCDAVSARNLSAPQRIVMSGFGVGLSWGVMSMTLDPKTCLPVVYTGESYDDGGMDFA